MWSNNLTVFGSCKFYTRLPLVIKLFIEVYQFYLDCKVLMILVLFKPYPNILLYQFKYIYTTCKMLESEQDS